MNPPSALHGAMSRERKPFTYTPGGLNLSEIKSERMAKRLMRNAMNQGVPETAVQNIKSPPISSNMAIPNFNCLPVQVFPTFNLPSNPKSLLRTRSNPDQGKEPPARKTEPVLNISTNFKPAYSDVSESLSFNNNTYPNSSVNNNNYVNNTRPASMYEYNTVPTNIYDSKTTYGSDGYSLPLLPEKSYDAQYFEVTPQGSKALGKIDLDASSIEIPQTIPELKPEKKICFEILEKPVTDEKCDPIEIPKPLEDTMATYDDQKEVKVQKEVNVTQSQNGDPSIEAAVTVKLPVKKSAAKTETRVQIENTILPDGTVEETKTTTTKTTVDGKVDISTKVEKRTLSKEEADAVIVVEEEEEEEEVEETEPETKERVVTETTVTTSRQKEEVQQRISENKTVEKSEPEKAKENGHEDMLIKEEERQEVTTTKKIVIVQSDDEEEEIVEEEEEEEETEVVDVKRQSQTQETVEEHEIAKEYDLQQPNDIQSEENEVEDEIEEIEQEEIKTDTIKEVDNAVKDDDKDDDEEVEEVEEKDENSEVKESVTQEEVIKEKKEEEEEEVEEVEEEEEYEEAEESDTKEVAKQEEEKPVVPEQVQEKESDEIKIAPEPEPKTEEIPIKVIIESSTTEPEISKEESKKPEEEISTSQPEPKQPLREPSIPLEKVIDIEIKPIGLGNDLFTKSHTEIITTSVDKPGALSTQTEYNRIENIVTVNRTTKTLDQAYEQMIQPSIPPVKTYFAPTRDTVSVSPQFNRPYQPVYPPEQTERRHSLLLERLSMERQLPPADIYQNYQYNQTDDNLSSQEPQSEVLTVSNVKPSTITKNQQWYQQTKKDNVTTYNNVTTPTIPTTQSHQWNQPKPQTQQQPQYQSQPQPPYQSQSQPQYQSQPQPQYQSQPQPQYQSQPQPQFQNQPQPQYQSPQPLYQSPQPQYQSQPSVQQSYTENIVKDTYKTINNYTQNVYPTYSPKPSNWISSVDNQNSYLKKDSTETYQTSTQQYSSSYVPPPWEQDPGYVADNTNQNFYQPPPPTSTFNNTSKPGWKPTPPAPKFTKQTPTSYIPPAPNQSFVKPVSNEEPPKLPGRKTYYSEYERRYISVPESTYIPTESKYQAQPDPSPKCYYDNNEPAEIVEPQWRKELREFTEKTSQTIVQTEQTSVRPPWEEDPKYVKTEYTPTPTWSQTLKPRSWRERSYESEFPSKEWPKTNTLGRGRPQSSYVKSGLDSPIPERTRGVSVDRYNPNSYQSPIPSEHPPVQTYTLNPNVQQNYHNPNVPAYHARAADDNREQAAIYQQPRQWGESRATPIQSRSFKYLQWITGTED